ncbi:putative bifunctional diguanylate cyclase/phosphodiesterase [Asticcacaulis machinosus]|uniref:EAL domain-containing protein n=1 Tax=Asticcacaulis machinosus TaxID=2984211 RepID=A0ABT5HMJ5_9CAUL|nr:EAL domain-containing protein [Asticcacaulis machinosus]MDC7677443.1 EAL domain-containing protein [Asticcacaulis machinosus]
MVYVLIFCGLAGLGVYLDLFRRFVDLAHETQTAWTNAGALIFLALLICGYVLSHRRAVALKAALENRNAAEMRLNEMAAFDALTGLPNRRTLSVDLNEALEARYSDHSHVGLMMIDLDHFKPVNDTHGHRAGDILLQMVAERLGAGLRDDSQLYRTSGDEFAVLFKVTDTDTHEDAALRLLQAFETPFDLNAESASPPCHLGVSIGIAVARCNDNLSGSDLLKRADMALHRAKDDGRGQIRYYDQDMDARIQARATLESDMRQAIRNGEIKAYYQPLVTLLTGEIEGYEVLARWHHPHAGTIAPYVFISVAEDMGLIDQLTLQLLGQACQDAQVWPDSVYISLNISPSQLKDHRLSKQILAVLKDNEIAPSRLEVEVTENALVQDYDTAKLILLALKHQGVRIALDDFGTGYSNLNHLRELPFDKLKIDSSFIMGAQRRPEDRKIVEAILSLCKSLDLATTAEGIENFETAHWLSEQGCKTGQGFLFGKAITGEEITVNGFCDDQIEALRIALSALIAADPEKSALMTDGRFPALLAR